MVIIGIIKRNIIKFNLIIIILNNIRNKYAKDRIKHTDTFLIFFLKILIKLIF